MAYPSINLSVLGWHSINFDKYVETDTGKDTIHDTVGIAYQDISPITQEILGANPPSEINSKNAAVSRKRIGTFECE